MKPRFFATPEKFRAWLAKNHGTAPELLVGFYRLSPGRGNTLVFGAPAIVAAFLSYRM